MPSMKWDGSDKLAAELASRPRGAARKLALDLGLESQANVSRWCRGTEPDNVTKERIEDALDMPRGWLSSPSDDRLAKLEAEVIALAATVEQLSKQVAVMGAAKVRASRRARPTSG